MKDTSLNKTIYIAQIGILGALAMLVMLIEIPLWFAPSFYKLDFSEIVALVGGFSLGPVAGVLIELIKNVLKFLIKGTETAGVGELANFLIGCAMILPASLVYRRHKTKKRALIGMGIGTLSMMFFGAFFNYFILIPFYSTFYGLPLDTIISMGSAVNPLVTSVGTLVAFATVPFNLVKGVICTVITMLTYKHLSPILKISSAALHKKKS